MRRVVVDTSVLAAVTFAEPSAEEWSPRIDGVELYAPTLLRYEMANVAHKRCRERPDQTREILDALDRALDPRSGITLMDPNPMDVVVLSNATGLSPYDASYLWLAGFLDADLLTRDRALAAAVDPYTGVELVE
jgi:predicted nucleic acid-binding protein